MTEADEFGPGGAFDDTSGPSGDVLSDEVPEPVEVDPEFAMPSEGEEQMVNIFDLIRMTLLEHDARIKELERRVPNKAVIRSRNAR